MKKETISKNNTSMLTVIIPIRASSDRKDAIHRLSFVMQDMMIPKSVKFLVVDDGSHLNEALAIMGECERLGFEYLRIESELQIFSAGRARNFAVQHAMSKYVLFQDLDLLPYPGFYRDALNEIEIQGLNQAAERFLMFGVIYLTKEATTEYFETPAELRKSKYIQALLDNDRSRVEKFSTGTSVTVWDRRYYLSCGGNDPEFEGWGYEDLEFTCRSIRRGRKFPLPDEFMLDYKNFQKVSEYRGWKSIYRLYGDLTFQKGMIMFHAWHPVDESGRYIKAKERNRKIFESKMRAFGSRREEPLPLPQAERGRSVIFRNNPWVYNRWVAPAFGELIHVDEGAFTPDAFFEFLDQRNIDRVVFHNPYANDSMLAIYEAVKLRKKPFIVCERGALPGSVFFDENGFNGESSSYATSRWLGLIDDEAIAKTSEYVKIFKEEGDDLEDQPERIGSAALRKKLGLRAGVKILFVPLQRPSDTVISHLSGPIESYENFLNLVRDVAENLPPDWVVVAKRHPLEVVSPDLPSVVLINDGNINDLVESSSAILLINSGVGLVGLMYEKPVLYAGTAFYGHEEIARQVCSSHEVFNALAVFRPNKEMIIKFLHYLIFEFYSFAEFKTRKVPWKDGSFMTATTEINYKTIRIPGCEELNLELRKSVQVGHDSVLFDRYRRPDGGIAGAPMPKKPEIRKDDLASNRLLERQVENKGRLQLTVAHENLEKANPPQDVLRRSSWSRKFKKLRQNPIMFLRDSKFFSVRNVGNSIKLN